MTGLADTHLLLAAFATLTWMLSVLRLSCAQAQLKMIEQFKKSMQEAEVRSRLKRLLPRLPHSLGLLQCSAFPCACFGLDSDDESLCPALCRH